MVDREALGAFLHLGDALAAETLCLSGFEVRMKRWDFVCQEVKAASILKETMLEECIHPKEHPVGSWNGKETCDFNATDGKDVLTSEILYHGV